MLKERLMINEQPDFSTESFEELFHQSITNVSSFNNQLVKGQVIKIVDDYIIVDVGLKSEGRISKAEFVDSEGNKEVLNEGDVIEVYIDRYESKDGSIVLSKEKAYREERWHKLESLYQEGTRVEGLITKRVKGGFMVLVNNTIAFLPGSQLDIRPIKNINSLVDTKQTLKILTMDRKRYNVVVSRRAVIEERLKEEGGSLSKQFSEGQIVEGVVKNITGYGCFVDLGSRDGLLHIIDVSWSRINHPSEVLKVGQTVKVKIIKIHPETERISLGMKQISEDPWVDIDKKYTIGSKFNVTITNVTDYGYFAELEKGIEGLIHISEVSWGRGSNDEAGVYKTGDKVEAIILDIDIKKRRISLSIKQGLPNPWVDHAEKYPVASLIEGVIKAVDDSGIAVTLTDEIQGFIRHYDISWDNSKEVLESYKDKIGEKIETKVLKYDLEREKVYLGLKQLKEDPFSAQIESFKKGNIVEAKVTKVSDNYISVELQEGITATIKRSELSLEKESQKTRNYNIGDVVTAMVINVDKVERAIYLSIRALEQVDQKKYLSEQESVSVSIGDILSDAMNNKKDK